MGYVEKVDLERARGNDQKSSNDRQLEATRFYGSPPVEDANPMNDLNWAASHRPPLVIYRRRL